MSVIDWEAKPEPWRSIGLRFCRDLVALQGLSETIDYGVSLASGDKLRYFRCQRGWTQEELARKSGYDERTILRIENAQVRFPGIETRHDIAQALGVDVADIWDKR